MQDEFARFYESNKDRVLRAVYVCTRDRDLAEDAVSEAFTRAYARWSKVSRHPSPVAWVTTTAVNSARSTSRRRKSRSLPFPDSPYALNEPLDRELFEAVLALPERQRQVVGLRLLLDLSTEQTAEVLGIAPGTTTSHLYRALVSLRSTLKKEELFDERC